MSDPPVGPSLSLWDENASLLMMKAAPPFSENRFLHTVLAAYVLIWIATALNPRDWLTWIIENILVFVFVAIFLATYRRFAFSNPSYLLIALFLSFHAIGTNTGYAHSPIGDWLREMLGTQRNPYDRVIHFGFGLLLAYPCRELLVRTGGPGGWAASWSAVSMIMAASVCFEVAESVIAEIVSPGTGPRWLGAQGDEWDMQFDLAAALLGAITAMVVTHWIEGNQKSACHQPQQIPPSNKPFRQRPLLQVLCALYSLIWAIAAIERFDRSDWLLENLLVFASVPVLILTYRRFPLSDTSYVLIFLFLVMHATGAHYTYAEVPLGYWIKDALNLERNHFDRIVHFSFGIMAYPVREMLLGTASVRGVWRFILPASIIVSFSGFFEILEAVIAVLVNPELGAAYLGLQGDVWDAQKDMALAILGALLILSVPSRRRRFTGRSDRRVARK
jgi:putative membrane protein